MNRPLFVVLLVALTLSITGIYYYLIASSVERQSNVVVIEMTTRQWRFDVLSISPPGSAEFSVAPATAQFANTTIIVRKGDTILLRIRNLDVPHGFGLQEFGINIVTPPEQVTEVKFVAAQTGSFIFFCTVFCGTGHPNHKGTLIVQG